MLTDGEHADVVRDAHAAIDAVMAYRAKTGASLEEAQKALPNPSADRYFRLTGFKLWTVYDVFYVRRSDYGPECPFLQKALPDPKGEVLRRVRSGHSVEMNKAAPICFS